MARVLLIGFEGGEGKSPEVVALLGKAKAGTIPYRILFPWKVAGDVVSWLAPTNLRWSELSVNKFCSGSTSRSFRFLLRITSQQSIAPHLTYPLLSSIHFIAYRHHVGQGR